MKPRESPFDAAISELEDRMRPLQLALRPLQTVLDTLKKLRSPNEVLAQDGNNSEEIRQAEVPRPHAVFAEMTIREAAKLYLKITGTIKSTADIAAALERGGIQTVSKNFADSVRAGLQVEEFIHIPEGGPWGRWALAEWYPEHGKQAAEGKQAPEVEKAKPPKRGKINKWRPRRNVGPNRQNRKNRQNRILEVMRTDPSRPWSATAVAREVQMTPKIAGTVMWAMRKVGLLEKDPLVGYRIPPAAPTMRQAS
jgi:hypothetical protein